MAKTHLFDVLVVSGDVHNITQSSMLKTGSQLFSGDELNVKAGAYVALMHKTGKTIELKKVGNHSVDALSKKISESSSYAEQYTDFVVKSFNKNNAQSRKNYSNTGAVSRGLKLFLRTPNKTAFVKGQDVILRWTKVDKAKGYKVQVFDNFQKVLYDKEIMDTTHTISFEGLGNQTRYVVKVSQIGAPSNTDKLTLSLYKNEESFDDLNRAFSGTKAIDFLVKAKFYERKGLLLQAQEFYLKAQEIEPNPAYKFQYNQFMHRNVKGI